MYQGKSRTITNIKQSSLFTMLFTGMRVRLRMFFSRFSSYYALRNRHFYWNIHMCT